MIDKFVKSVLLALISFALAAPGYSQSNTTQKERNRDSQTTRTPAAGADQNQNAPGATSANATAKAVESSLAQVELGKLALDKTKNPRVKKFADTMVSDHNDALMKLSSVPGGNASGVKLNAKHEQLKARLSKLSGVQFDRAYMNAMVTDQQER